MAPVPAPAAPLPTSDDAREGLLPPQDAGGLRRPQLPETGVRLPSHRPRAPAGRRRALRPQQEHPLAGPAHVPSGAAAGGRRGPTPRPPSRTQEALADDHAAAGGGREQEPDLTRGQREREGGRGRRGGEHESDEQQQQRAEQQSGEAVVSIPTPRVPGDALPASADTLGDAGSDVPRPKRR